MLKHNSTGINKKYDEGETLLHIAVRNEIIDVIHLLINYGADIDAKDDNGMTTIDYAAKSGNADIFNFLTEQWSHGIRFQQIANMLMLIKRS
ncbi:ankyrin repeat family protein [Orientia tsutsugamushi str. TA763]|nr:ankyrin repeat family protein [Orientia tsutsugamushi str. TA763]